MLFEENSIDLLMSGQKSAFNYDISPVSCMKTRIYFVQNAATL